MFSSVHLVELIFSYLSMVIRCVTKHGICPIEMLLKFLVIGLQSKMKPTVYNLYLFCKNIS